MKYSQVAKDISAQFQARNAHELEVSLEREAQRIATRGLSYAVETLNRWNRNIEASANAESSSGLFKFFDDSSLDGDGGPGSKRDRGGLYVNAPSELTFRQVFLRSRALETAIASLARDTLTFTEFTNTLQKWAMTISW